MNHAQGWNGTHQIFRELIEKHKPTTIIEVGTWKGQSAITMALACKELGLQTKIYCIDTWLGALEFMGYGDNDPERGLKRKDGYPQVYFEFLENIRNAGVADTIIPVPQTAEIASRWLKQQGITAEMIYIDASHDADDVERDVLNYKDIATKVIFGDDYLNRDYTVKEGVLRILPESDIQVVDKNFWIYAK